MLNQKLYKIEKENAFSRSTRLVEAYRTSHPDRELISLGIGDVSFPVAPPIVDAMQKACDDLRTMERFPGYGHYFGIPSLRRTIAEKEYGVLGISADEIYIGDGTKTDSTALLELFDINSKILVGNPMYPIYQNGAFALGRDVFYGACDKAYKMTVPTGHYDIIYLCSPSNPVGNALTKTELRAWIDYAAREKAVIFYDNVYADFIESPDVPKSIYEVSGSRDVAIEFRSFSKNASFSGIRCSYFVLPAEFGAEIRDLWRERTINRFNGACYIAQKGAEASYKPEARAIMKRQIEVYKENARFLRDGFTQCGFTVVGGQDAPYLWVQTPDKKTSWEAFRFFLEELQIIVVPGVIFGTAGEYNIRISSLGTPENAKIAVERMKRYYEKNI